MTEDNAPDSAQERFGPDLGPTLSRRQEVIFARLSLMSSDLSQMYAGAYLCIQSTNPDRWAQSAHSARELIEKLLDFPEFPDPTKRLGHPRDKARELRDEWQRFKSNDGRGPNDLRGTEVSGELFEVLKRVEGYAEASDAFDLTARRKVERALGPLGLVDNDLPPGLKKADVEELNELWSFFKHAAHHGHTREQVERELDHMDSFLNRWIPETFEDLKAIDELLGGHQDA